MKYCLHSINVSCFAFYLGVAEVGVTFLAHSVDLEVSAKVSSLRALIS